MAFLFTPLGIFNMPQIYDMGPTALCPLRRKACWGFFALKNPTASAGFEPANLGTKVQHATPRPPKRKKNQPKKRTEKGNKVKKRIHTVAEDVTASSSATCLLNHQFYSAQKFDICLHSLIRLSVRVGNVLNVCQTVPHVVSRTFTRFRKAD